MAVEEMAAGFTNKGDYAGPGPLMALGQEDINGNSATEMNYVCHDQDVLEIIFSRHTPPFFGQHSQASCSLVGSFLCVRYKNASVGTTDLGIIFAPRDSILKSELPGNLGSV